MLTTKNLKDDQVSLTSTLSTKYLMFLSVILMILESPESQCFQDAMSATSGVMSS